VSSSNAEWWLHLPTFQTVSVTGGTIALPFLTYLRPDHIAGNRSIRLDEYLASAPFAVADGTITDATSPGFALPPALVARPVALASPARFTVRLARSGTRRLVVSGHAAPGTRVTVTLRRGKRLAARRTVRTGGAGSYRVRLAARKAGRYRVTATAQVGGRPVSLRSRVVRVR
jgi:hypothetical protein